MHFVLLCAVGFISGLDFAACRAAPGDVGDVGGVRRDGGVVAVHRCAVAGVCLGERLLGGNLFVLGGNGTRFHRLARAPVADSIDSVLLRGVQRGECVWPDDEQLVAIANGGGAVFRFGGADGGGDGVDVVDGFTGSRVPPVNSDGHRGVPGKLPATIAPVAVGHAAGITGNVRDVCVGLFFSAPIPLRTAPVQ